MPTGREHGRVSKREGAPGGQMARQHLYLSLIHILSQMVPGARVGIAHGKMTEEELNLSLIHI